MMVHVPDLMPTLASEASEAVFVSGSPLGL